MPDEQKSTEGQPNTDPATTPPANTDTGKAPNWEGEFSPERAAQLVANLRAERDDAKGKLKTYEDAGKSELEKAIARAEAAEKRAEATEKTAAETAHALAVRTAADAVNLPADLHEFLTGKTPEDLKAQAEKLAEKFGITGATPPTQGRPKPRLVPGNGADPVGADFDPEAIAKRARRR